MLYEPTMMPSKGPFAVTCRNLCGLPEQMDASRRLQYGVASAAFAYVYDACSARRCSRENPAPCTEISSAEARRQAAPAPRFLWGLRIVIVA